MDIKMSMQSFRKIVAIEDPLINAEARQKMGDYADKVIIYDDLPSSDEEIINRIGDADAVLLTFRTHLGRNVLEACPALEYIGLCCTLYDEKSCSVDIAVARERGVTVKGVRDYGDEGVVEYAISETVRYLHGFGDRQWKPYRCELGGLRTGIVGLGKTGRMLADAFRFFGSEVHYFSRTRKPDAESAGIGYLPLHDLLSVCDLVITTLPRGTVLLREEEFGIMGGGRMLMNTSIGPTFDVAALKCWLKGNSDSCYFCDGTGMGTLGDELATLSNVFYTPAVAGMSIQSTQRLSDKVLANIRDFLAGI